MFLRFYSMVLLKILVTRYLTDTMESNFGNMILLGHKQLPYKDGNFTKKPLRPPSIEIYQLGTSCPGDQLSGG